MKVSDDLFQLINSLSKSEKRYFKLHSKNQNSSEKYNYLALFSAIEKQEEYNEHKIIETFKSKTFIKHLPSEKNYLYNLILKSLNKYYAVSSVDIEVEEIYNSAKILYKKGLYDQCEKMVNKGLQLARKMELFTSVIKVSELQMELIPHIVTDAVTMQRSFEQCQNETNIAFEKLQNLSLFQNLKAILLEQFRTKGEFIRRLEDDEVLTKLLQNPLLENESKALSKKAKIIYHFILGAIYYVTGQNEKTFQYELQGLKLYDSDEVDTDDNISSYSATLSNFCDTCLRLKDYLNFEKYLEKLKQTPFQFLMDESRRFYRIADLELRYLSQTGKFKDASALIKGIEEGLIKYEGRIHISREISIKYYIAYVYFGIGEYKNAVKWIGKILNEKTDLRSDFLTHSRILNCIAHFEIGDDTSLESVQRATGYYLYKKPNKNKWEGVFMSYFNRLVKTPDKKDQVKIFLNWLNEVKELSKNAAEDFNNEYFDFVTWLESKIQEKNFAELVFFNAKNQKRIIDS